MDRKNDSVDQGSLKLFPSLRAFRRPRLVLKYICTHVYILDFRRLLHLGGSFAKDQVYMTSAAATDVFGYENAQIMVCMHMHINIHMHV